MPDINVTITIPDTNVAEVSEATGATNKAQFQDWVRDRVKDSVISLRQRQTEAAEESKVESAREARDVAVQAAIDAVDTDVVLG